ncbi:MAG TPA: HK97 family phage prohead protease [Chloroflexota bacterium]|jgi:hypothetical protein
MEHKALRLELKADSDQSGAVSARFAVYGGPPDSQGDVMMPGSIPEQDVLMVFGHDWARGAVGRGRTRNTAEGSVFDGRFFLDTLNGSEAYKTVRAAGDLQEWSYGFQTKAARPGEIDGVPVRFVEAIELFEVSPVLIGANRATSTLSIKGDLDAWELEERAVWSSAYVNSLPDAAFAVIESGGSRDQDGRTVPRSLRHFPHHRGEDGLPLDAPHVRNALARIPQSRLSDALKSRAEAHVRRHANSMDIGKARNEVAAALDAIGHVMDHAALELASAPLPAVRRRELLAVQAALLGHLAAIDTLLIQGETATQRLRRDVNTTTARLARTEG